MKRRRKLVNENFFRVDVYAIAIYLTRIAASMLDYHQDQEKIIKSHKLMIADNFEHYKLIETVQNVIDHAELLKKFMSADKEERSRIVDDQKKVLQQEVITQQESVSEFIL